GCEDWDFWLNLACHGRTGYTIPEFLFNYRIKPQNEQRTWDTNVAKFVDGFRIKYKKLYDDPLTYPVLVRSRLLTKDTTGAGSDVGYGRLVLKTFHDLTFDHEKYNKQIDCNWTREQCEKHWT